MVHPHLVASILLVAATVAIHSGGGLAIMKFLVRARPHDERHFGFARNTAVTAAVVVSLMCIHAIEVGVWASFFFVKDCFPDISTALYFSLTAYSTLGGNVLIEDEWRMLGGVEALTGILMVGWSTAIMIGHVNWVYSRGTEQWSRETG